LRYIVAVLVVTFVLSGVLPRYIEWRDRVRRVQEFKRQYRRWVDAVEKFDGVSGYGGPPPDLLAALAESNKLADEIRPWLTARRNEMQRDAKAVGKGVMYVAPPPMIGGSYKPHAYFLDLFDAQTDSIGSRAYRLDDLVTIVHESEWQRDLRRRDLYNPAAWGRLAFERVVRFPAYVLKLVGFSEKTAGSSAVKVVSAVWSLLVGAATIAGFVVTVTH
jgi:hypothetical protein